MIRTLYVFACFLGIILTTDLSAQEYKLPMIRN